MNKFTTLLISAAALAASSVPAEGQLTDKGLLVQMEKIKGSVCTILEDTAMMQGVKQKRGKRPQTRVRTKFTAIGEGDTVTFKRELFDIIRNQGIIEQELTLNVQTGEMVKLVSVQYGDELTKWGEGLIYTQEHFKKVLQILLKPDNFAHIKCEPKQ